MPERQTRHHPLPLGLRPSSARGKVTMSTAQQWVVGEWPTQLHPRAMCVNSNQCQPQHPNSLHTPFCGWRLSPAQGNVPKWQWGPGGRKSAHRVAVLAHCWLFLQNLPVLAKVSPQHYGLDSGPVLCFNGVYIYIVRQYSSWLCGATWASLWDVPEHMPYPSQITLLSSGGKPCIQKVTVVHTSSLSAIGR